MERLGISRQDVEEIEAKKQLERQHLEAQAAQAEREEKKLIAELESEDRQLEEERERLAGLPKESSQEKENRELRERVEALESARRGERASASAPPGPAGTPGCEPGRWLRKDAIRLLRIRKQDAERTALSLKLGLPDRQAELTDKLATLNDARRVALHSIDDRAETERREVRERFETEREAAERDHKQAVDELLAGADKKTKELITVGH